jgi:multidrug resistance efflux pump
MNAVAPRLRPDLEIRSQPATDGPVYILKDPLSGEFYRLREAEHFIARQFDGQTPLEAIRERTETRFGATLPPEMLAAFVRRLRRSHLLETSDAAGKGGARRGGLVRGNLLYLRFKLCDPDRLLGLLAPRLGFLFTAWFATISGALILLAAGTMITNRDELAREIGDLAGLATISLIVAVLFALVTVHEFAHGLACKRYGGGVHEMGFMLLYFQPALYCNVSDAWFFPEKRQRLMVGFAGPYAELTLWAAATLVWRLTDPEAWIHLLALIVAGSSGIKTLLNFNPLLKFDGYYLLSDFLEVPNLRTKSFAYIGDRLKGLFGGEVDHAEVAPRLRRIYLRYGITAVAFSWSALIFGIILVGDYFVDNRGPVSVLIALLFVGAKMNRWIRRLFRPRSASSGPQESGKVAPPREVPRRDAPPRRRAPRWVWYAIGAAAAAALLFTTRMELRIAGPFNVLPQENADVRAPLEQIIEEIYVEEGQIVNPGDPIARLDDRPLHADLASTQAAIEQARANLRKLKVGPTAAEIDVARAGVAKAGDSLKYATRRVEKLTVLYRQGLISQKELDDAEELAAAAANDGKEAGTRLHLLEVGTRPEEIAATTAQIEQLESQRQYLEDQLALLRIVSPVAGVVATPTRQLKELRHQLLKKGDLILKVYDITTVTAQIFVSERELEGITVGQRVELMARAYPGTTFHGTVTSIATSAQGGTGTISQAGMFTSGSADPNKSIIVTTRIDNQSLLLKPEMTGQAKIFCGSRGFADLVTRRLALTFRVALWSWW